MKKCMFVFLVCPLILLAFSCGVTNMIFGFDIILYDENNVRVHKDVLETFNVTLVNSKKDYNSSINIKIATGEDNKETKNHHLYLNIGSSSVSYIMDKKKDSFDESIARMYIKVEDKQKRYKIAYSKTLDHYFYTKEIKIRLERK